MVPSRTPCSGWAGDVLRVIAMGSRVLAAFHPPDQNKSSGETTYRGTSYREVRRELKYKRREVRHTVSGLLIDENRILPGS